MTARSSSPPPPSSSPQKASRAELLLAQFHEEAQPASQRVDWQMLRDLWPYARPHLGLYLVALLLMPCRARLGVPAAAPQRAVDSMGLGVDTAALGKVR